MYSDMKKLLYGIIVMICAVFVLADDNDDGYLTTEYCGSYLCSKYAKEAALYLSNRCLGNFEDYVSFSAEEVATTFNVSSGTSIKSVVLLSLSIFSISFLVGLCSSCSRRPEITKSTELHNTFTKEGGYGSGVRY